MAVRWHMVFILSWMPRKSYGGLTAAVRQTCSSCNDREVAVRSPPVLLAVTLCFFISWFIRLPCGRRNICDHNYRSPQDLTILKNHVLQTIDHRTVRRPYGGSMICDRGISQHGGCRCPGTKKRFQEISHNHFWLQLEYFGKIRTALCKEQNMSIQFGDVYHRDSSSADRIHISDTENLTIPEVFWELNDTWSILRT